MPALMPPQKTLAKIADRMPAMLRVDAERAEHQIKQTVLIQRLLKEYNTIVLKNVQDAVPKAVMLKMVNKSKDLVQDELLMKLYDGPSQDPAMVDELLEEHSAEAVREEREAPHAWGTRRPQQRTNRILRHGESRLRRSFTRLDGLGDDGLDEVGLMRLHVVKRRVELAVLDPRLVEQRGVRHPPVVKLNLPSGYARVGRIGQLLGQAARARQGALRHQ